MPDDEFVIGMNTLCHKYNTCLIADEVQSGFSRSGKFFAFQHNNIQPHVITMAKGMGNGFPIGGILVHPDLKPKHGMLGTTFGGNHLACTASLAVLKIIKKINYNNMLRLWMLILELKPKRFQEQKLKAVDLCWA